MLTEGILDDHLVEGEFETGEEMGIEGVLAQSFARTYKANLFNFGLLPRTIDKATYVRIDQGDDVEIFDDVAEAASSG
jgi:aconitate hydratase